MINSIIKAVSIALYAEFGFENHMEEIKQDLKEPCFFISCLNPASDLYLGKRYFRKNQFVIQYFPESDDIQEECNNVAEKMVWCLEYITADGDILRGTKMKYGVIDGVLNFFLNYDLFVYKVEQIQPIELYERSINVKG